jgi:hypothetical protein
VKGPRALVIGEGSGRRTDASTPATTKMTASVVSFCPVPSEGVRTPRSGMTPRRMHSEIKGLKAHKGEKGYWLKMPRRPIKLIGFKDWPTNGFTTALGTTRVRSEDGWAR